jgi:hypothetical protein
VASAAAVALAAVGASVYGFSGTTRPLRSAAGHVPAALPAPRVSPSSAAEPGCASVRVSGAPAGCAGGYSQPSTALPAGTAAPTGAGEATSGPSYGAVHANTYSVAPSGSAATAAPEELAVGQSVAVDLPVTAGLAWGVPHLESSVAAGTGVRASAAVLRAQQAATGPGGAASASFLAAHPGTAVLVADATEPCAARGRCGPVELVWSLQVSVEGT